MENMSDNTSAAADDYSSGDYGRIRQMDDSVELQRADGEDVRETAAVNAPIFPGDAMRTERESKAEVELAAGNVIWLSGDTSLRFLALPSPYAESEDRTVLQKMVHSHLEKKGLTELPLKEALFDVRVVDTSNNESTVTVDALCDTLPSDWEIASAASWPSYPSHE